MFLTLSLMFSIVAIPVSARGTTTLTATEQISVSEFESLFPDQFEHSSSYTDSEGNNGYFQYETIDGDTFVEVYLNGELTQRAHASPKNNVVQWFEYEDYTTYTRAVDERVETCKYTDMVADVSDEDVTNSNYDNYDIETYATKFSPEGWAYVMTRPSNPTIAGSKPCAIYKRNYDDEPDLHRYNGKRVKADKGTAISVIISLLAVFLSGNVTITTIIIGLGSGIAGDFITKAVMGQVCFSTQKIRYAPVIGGMNIFPDAYITKRWVIISDTAHKKETFELDNPSYANNRGHDIYAIAYNAQHSEANNR